MKKGIIVFLILALGVAVVVIYCSPFRTFIPGVRNNTLTLKNYANEKDSVLKERDALAKQLKVAVEDQKKNIYKNAGLAFAEGLNDHLFQYWYETDWDFNGTSQEPGKGSIACGYFVTTLLRDMGVELDRVALAQSASEQMIKSLVAEKYIHRFSNYSIKDFVNEIKKLGDGIYLTGLDNHTGFIVCENGNVDFVHSDGGAPARVLKEVALNSVLLTASKYRVVGKITSDEEFLSKWLNKENIGNRD